MDQTVALSSALEAIYLTAAEPDNWPQALQAIADCFGDVGAVLLWYRDDGGVGSIASPGIAIAQKDYQERGWHYRDVRSRLAAEKQLWAKQETVTERHFISYEEMSREPFYTEFLAKHGLGYCMAIGLLPAPNLPTAISVQRAAGRPPYSDEDLSLLARLGRHAENTLRLNIRLVDNELSRIELTQALNYLAIGVFALDSCQRVVFMNDVGRKLIGQDLELRHGRLTPFLTYASEGFERAFALAREGPCAHGLGGLKPVLLRRGAGRRPLVLYVLPVADQAQVIEAFLAQTQVIVLAIDADADAPPDPALVRDVLGLTLGEARIAALIGDGVAPREASVRLGLSEGTVRTVLKTVFSKLGIQRQGELVALMTKLVLR